MWLLLTLILLAAVIVAYARSEATLWSLETLWCVLVGAAAGLLGRGVRAILIRRRLRRSIGSYEDVKCLIRSGKGRPYPAKQRPQPRVPPPEEIFRITDTVELWARLRDHVFEKETGGLDLTDAEHVFDRVSSLEAEVNNGGFDQYFFNSAGAGARHVVAALDEIGAPATAEIVRQAVVVFGDVGPSADREERWDQMDQLPDTAQERLDTLDGEFYACDEALLELVVDYARAHAREFTQG